MASIIITAAHETTGDPLAGTIKTSASTNVRDGVAAHETTGDPLAGTIKSKKSISVCCNDYVG